MPSTDLLLTKTHNRLKFIHKCSDWVLIIWIVLKIALFVSELTGFSVKISQDHNIGHFIHIMHPAVGFFILFFTILLHTHILPKLLEKVEEQQQTFLDRVDEVKEMGIDSITAATGFLERAFGLQVTTRLRENFNKELIEALQAISFNLQNWENRITENDGTRKELTKDDKKIALWLRYMRTYYFEEALDVQNKELVTNARNFCFLLLATLQGFLENLQKKEKLYFYAVTPVHPKDWYNWPHGISEPRAYFEEDFIGLYYRSLREIVKSNNDGERLFHGRILLTKNYKDGPEPFGWRLDFKGDVEDQLKNTKIFPIAIEMDWLEGFSCKVIKELWVYYDWMNKLFPKSNNKERFFVPLFCATWKKDKITKHFDNEILKANGDASKIAGIKIDQERIEDAWKYISEHIDNADLTGLIDLARDKYKVKLSNELLGNIKPLTDCTKCQKTYRKIKKNVGDVILNRKVNMVDFIQNVHHYSVLIFEHSDIGQPDNLSNKSRENYLRTLLLYTLRLKDIQRLRSPYNWKTLNDVFRINLHTKKSMFKLEGLGFNQIDKWVNDGLRPEFSFFGIRKKDMDIEWKLVIDTSITYPFDVTKIQFVEPNDPSWEKYSSKIQDFITAGTIEIS